MKDNPFDSIFGDWLSKDHTDLSLVDRQQAEEATNKSGLTDQKMMKRFHDVFINARRARKQAEFMKI